MSAIQKRKYKENNTNLEIVTGFEKLAIKSINETFPFAIQSTCFFSLFSKHLSNNPRTRPFQQNTQTILNLIYLPDIYQLRHFFPLVYYIGTI